MTKDMTMGSPLRMILLFSVPVLLGNIFQQFYNMVDTIIVGQYLGEDALAAVGSTGCLMFLVLGFANGIAQGFGVMVSHAFGAKDFKLLKHYVALSLILTAIVSLLLTIPTVAASRQFLILNENTGQYLGLADSYIKVIFAGILLTMSYNVAAGILRGIGDSKTPLYFLILSSFLNIVLDLFLIVVVKLGTAGAAYATIIAQGVSALLCFIYMFRKFDILKTSREDYYLDGYGVFNMLPSVFRCAQLFHHRYRNHDPAGCSQYFRFQCCGCLHCRLQSGKPLHPDHADTRHCDCHLLRSEPRRRKIQTYLRGNAQRIFSSAFLSRLLPLPSAYSADVLL